MSLSLGNLGEFACMEDERIFRSILRGWSSSPISPPSSQLSPSPSCSQWSSSPSWIWPYCDLSRGSPGWWGRRGIHSRSPDRAFEDDADPHSCYHVTVGNYLCQSRFEPGGFAMIPLWRLSRKYEVEKVKWNPVFFLEPSFEGKTWVKMMILILMRLVCHL